MVDGGGGRELLYPIVVLVKDPRSSRESWDGAVFPPLVLNRFDIQQHDVTGTMLKYSAAAAMSILVNSREECHFLPLSQLSQMLPPRYVHAASQMNEHDA